MVAKRGNNTIGDVLVCKKGYNPLNVVIIALDGTPYLQTTGTATDRRAVALYCDTEDKRVAVDNAANDGALITVEWLNNVQLLGYIEGKISWREFPDWNGGVAKFNFLVKEVIGG